MGQNSTIYALSSGAGKAGVAVIRLSGPEAFAMAGAIGVASFEPRKASYCVFRKDTGEPIDRGLAISFAGPSSFTGEDVVEFHVHGTRAVINAVCAALSKQGGEAAAPGAFTRRAFDNGKLDLSQSEALADLVDAETESQRRQALGQLGGNLSDLAKAWRAALIEASCPLEAAIDFTDEADVPEEAMMQAAPVIEEMIAGMNDLIDAAPVARRVREGVRIVLFGPPNSGKSSLLNALSGSDRAIVSEIAGTTRDSLDVWLDINGVACILTDTAGLRASTKDMIEHEGMRRTQACLAEADLKISVQTAERRAAGTGIAHGLAGDMIQVSAKGPAEGISERAAQGMSEDISGGDDEAGADLCLWNKVDLLGEAGRAADDFSCEPPAARRPAFGISAKTGEGMPRLIGWLETQVTMLAGNPGAVALTRERHIEQMLRARAALIRALPLLARRQELAAEEMRHAMAALERITGKIDVEDVLGQIFSSFCIGK